MPRRSARFPVALTVALLALTSCGADRDDEPGPVRFNSGTFGGPGADDLVDAVLTPAGPVLVGTWRDERDGLDISTWTNDGARWVRGPAAGTRPGSRTFPMAATALREGILVVGWELADGKQRPVVWRSSTGGTGWTTTALPDVAAPGAAVAARCWKSVCAVAGRVYSELAVWSLTDGEWTRLRPVQQQPAEPLPKYSAPERVRPNSIPASAVAGPATGPDSARVHVPVRPHT